jgi:DHA1 family tetracycline resistance protein-like MFS transporter
MPASRESQRRAAVPFILITVLLDTLGVGLIIPVGPRLVASFLGDDLASASRWFGLLIALYAVMQFIFAPVLGGLSDRFGRRAVILSSLMGAAASYLLSALAPSLGWLFLGRTIAGITGASFSAANAYIADITPPEKRAANFGASGAVLGLGFILGPALGGALGDYGLRIPYFVGAGLNFLNLLYGLFVLPESLPKASRRSFSFARANPVGSMRNLARHPLVLRLTATLFFTFLSQLILQSVWALSNQERFGWSLKQVGLSLMAVGLGTAVVQGLLVRMLMPWLRERRALLLGLLFSSTGFVLFGIATEGWMIYAFLPVLSLSGIAGPAVQAIITGQVGPKEQGELQGAINSLQGLAAIIGPLIGTTLLARFGPADVALRIPGAPFFASAAFTFTGLLLAVRALRSTPKAPPAPPLPLEPPATPDSPVVTP